MKTILPSNPGLACGPKSATPGVPGTICPEQIPNKSNPTATVNIATEVTKPLSETKLVL